MNAAAAAALLFLAQEALVGEGACGPPRMDGKHGRGVGFDDSSPKTPTFGCHS